MGCSLFRLRSVDKHIRHLIKKLCKAQLALAHVVAICAQIAEVILYRRLHAHYAGGIGCAAAQVFLLSSAYLATRKLYAVSHIQRAHALGRVELVSADGIKVTMSCVKGHLEETLNSIHMQQCIGGFFLKYAANSLGVIYGAHLVIHLHNGYKTGVRSYHFLKLCKVYCSGMIHRRFLHVILLIKAFEGLVYRGVLSGPHNYPALSSHCLQGAEECHVVAFRAAGGKDDLFSCGIYRPGYGLSGGVYGSLLPYRRRICRRRVKEFFRHILPCPVCRRRQRGGGCAVIKIYHN